MKRRQILPLVSQSGHGNNATHRDHGNWSAPNKGRGSVLGQIALLSERVPMKQFQREPACGADAKDGEHGVN